MKDDDVVRRVGERERQAAEAKAREQFDREEPIREEIRALRYATYALLGDIRQNIQALVAANERELEILHVRRSALSSVAVETVGWRLSSPGYVSRGVYDEHEEWAGLYLLHDGRLASYWPSEAPKFMGDEHFDFYVAKSSSILERIAGLYERAGLRMPEVPKVPVRWSDFFWAQVVREPVPKPLAGVRFYTDADCALEPHKKGWHAWRSGRRSGR
jgi:hypothetical protein